MKMTRAHIVVTALLWLLASLAFNPKRAHAKKLRHYTLGFSANAKKAVLTEYNRLRIEKGDRDNRVTLVRDGNSVRMEAVTSQGPAKAKIWNLPGGESAVVRIPFNGNSTLHVAGEELTIYEPFDVEDERVLRVWEGTGEKKQYHARSMLDPRVRSIVHAGLIQEEDETLVVALEDGSLTRIEKDDIDGSKAARLAPGSQEGPVPLPVKIGRALYGGKYQIASHGNQTSFFEQGFDKVEKMRVWNYRDANILSVLTWGENGTGVLNNLFDKKVSSYQLLSVSREGPYFEGRRGDDIFFISKENPHKVSAPFRHVLEENRYRYLVENQKQGRWFIWKHGDPKEGTFQFRGEPVDDSERPLERVLVSGLFFHTLEISKTEPKGWKMKTRTTTTPPSR